MEININKFAVRDSAGNIDETATLEKFRETLTNWSQESTADLSEVRKAIMNVFDANPGKRLTTAYITAQVLGALGPVDEKEFKLRSERVDSILGLPPFTKTVGAKGGVSRNVEAAEAPSVEVYPEPAPKAPKKVENKTKSEKKQGKQSGKGKSASA